MNDIYTAAQAAQRLGTTYAALRNWLKRNPAYRPIKFGQTGLWTQADIDRVAAARVETAQMAAHEQAKRNSKSVKQALDNSDGGARQ